MQFKWTGFPLHPETPEAGLELSDLFAGRGLDIAAMQQRLLGVASELGLPLTPRSRTFNSRRAQQLGKFAEKVGCLEGFQQSVYHAFFVEGRNIGRLEELLEIAQRAGILEQEARLALEDEVFAKEVDQDWQRARVLGISGVPAFLSDRKLLIGFRPYQELEALIRGAGGR